MEVRVSEELVWGWGSVWREAMAFIFVVISVFCFGVRGAVDRPCGKPMFSGEKNLAGEIVPAFTWTKPSVAFWFP